MSLLVEELFDYTAQDLHNLNGGTGWTAAWVTTNTLDEPEVVADNLEFSGVSNGSPANASKMKCYNEGANTKNMTWSRDFTGIPNSVAGAKYYFAWIQASDLAKGDAYIYLDKLTTDSGGGTPAKILAWDAGLSEQRVFALAIGGTTLYTGSSSYVPHLIVIELTMSGAAGTKVTTKWFVDPDPAADPSTWTATKTDTDLYVSANITRIGWNSGTAATTGSDSALIYMDNLRIATTSYEAFGNTSPVTSNGNFFMFF